MIVWPFFPNWKSTYQETYAYLTEIITSDSGKEQRRAYRVCARREVSYKSLVHRDRLRALLRSLNHQATAFVFPDEVRRAHTLTVAATGTKAVTLDAAPAWLSVGLDVVFEDRATRTRAVRTIASITGSTVGLVDESPRDWATDSRVMPALVGTLDPSVQVKFPTDEIGDANIAMLVEPGTEIETIPPARVMFRGREVLAHRPNWSDPLQIESTDPTQYTDYDIGVRTPFRLVAFGTDIVRSSHLVRSSSDLNDTLGLFMRCKGRRGEFYCPTHLNDIRVDTAIAAGSTSWSVPGHDFFDAYNGDTVRRAFAVRLNTGAEHYFAIASMSKSTAGSDRTIITTLTPAPLAIGPDDIARISWMPVCRFVSDELAVTWITDRLAEVNFNIQTTEDRA